MEENEEEKEVEDIEDWIAFNKHIVFSSHTKDLGKYVQDFLEKKGLQ